MAAKKTALQLMEEMREELDTEIKELEALKAGLLDDLQVTEKKLREKKPELTALLRALRVPTETKARLTTEQKAAIVADTGTTVKDLSEKWGVSQATICRWRKDAGVTGK